MYKILTCNDDFVAIWDTENHEAVELQVEELHLLARFTPLVGYIDKDCYEPAYWTCSYKRPFYYKHSYIDYACIDIIWDNEITQMFDMGYHLNGHYRGDYHNEDLRVNTPYATLQLGVNTTVTDTGKLLRINNIPKGKTVNLGDVCNYIGHNAIVKSEGIIRIDNRVKYVDKEFVRSYENGGGWPKIHVDIDVDSLVKRRVAYLAQEQRLVLV